MADPEKTTPDTEGEWSQPRTDGVYVSAAGYHCCSDCQAVLEPTGEKLDEETWHPYVWQCPSCGETYNL